MKKLFISIVSICCVFLNVLNASAYAKPEDSIKPKGIAFQCECGGLTQRITSAEDYLWVTTHDCTHGLPNKVHVYEVYGVHVIDRCTRCGSVYDSFSIPQREVFLCCDDAKNWPI